MKTTLIAFALCLVTIVTDAQENFQNKEGKWGIRLNGKIIVPPPTILLTIIQMDWRKCKKKESGGLWIRLAK
jgi:hypothetical protein